jgi:hypothetical protein
MLRQMVGSEKKLELTQPEMLRQRVGSEKKLELTQPGN